MRLLEFQKSQIAMRDLITALSHSFDMERVGGRSRIYDVGDRQGVIFLLNNSLKGLGLIWSKGSTNVQSVGVWSKIDFDKQPDVVADIPPGDLEAVLPALVAFIRHPIVGVSESLLEGATGVEEFRTAAKKFFGPKAKKLTLGDLRDVEDQTGSLIPAELRSNSPYQIDAQHWNLWDNPSNARSVAVATGGHVGKPDPQDAKYNELTQFKSLRNLKHSGAVVIVGRKPNGEIFEIPGLDTAMAQIERMIGKQLTDLSSGGDSSMEEQYSILEDKVKLIVGGESDFIKSLLITGMPSAGKTFRVMKTVKESGLEAGKDYMTKKGKISAKSLYRVLIQQINGLAIFDDCDSVVGDPDAVNMLKGALDTDPVRTVDYDVQGLMNTDAMSFERRGEIVKAMSAILRGVPTEEQLTVIERLMTNKRADKAAKKSSSSDDFMMKFFTQHKDEEASESSDTISLERIREAETFVMDNLPNKIDFEGRIIFISNMSEDEWRTIGDGAIINRAFHQNMAFSDNEMLDYIDGIKGHIKANLSETQKQEVLDYLRELWQAGKITKPVNFRLVQQCFDLYKMNDWRTLMANIG